MANVSSSNGLEKRPKLRFPGFDEPWEHKELLYYLVENTDRNKQLKFGKENVLSVSGEYGIVNQIAFQGRSFAGESVADYHVVETDDIVYTKSPLKANPYGIIKVNNGVPGIVSTLYAVYHPLKTVVPRFVDFYFSNDLRLNKFLKPLVNIGAKHDMKVNNTFVLTGMVVFPPLREQQKIVDFLTILDRRIDVQRKKVEALKKYKRGLLSREFGQQENGDLNNRYVGKLKDYFHLSSGSTPSSTNRAFYSGNIRWVSSGELKPKYLCETSQHISSEAVSSCNLREYPANTLLVAMYGLEAAGVRGTASILSVPATISQACMAIQQTGEIDIEYLYYWYIYNGQWIGIRIAQGTKQQNLSTDTLGNLRIHAPSCSKQKKVCKLLSQIDYLIEKEGQKIDLLSSAKRGLLQQLFI
mgnify:FL=1|jgi:type I restriction enzyme S subunit